MVEAMRKRKAKLGFSKGQRIFNVFNIIILSVLLVLFVFPYLLIISASVTDNYFFIREGYAIFPSKFSLEAYKFAFSSDQLLIRSMLNSVLLTVTGTAATVLVTTLSAYALSKLNLKGRRIFLFLIIFSMIFSGGVIPTYMLMSALKLTNTYFSIILPGLTVPWYLLLVRNYFIQVPKSLEEAANMDGASHVKIFLKIYLPISMPMLATIILFTAIGYWNNWTSPMLYISSRYKEIWPVQLMIREFLYAGNSSSGPGGGSSVGFSVPSATFKMAAVVISSLPIIIVYPFLQKYFISGIMLGSVKE